MIEFRLPSYAKNWYQIGTNQLELRSDADILDGLGEMHLFVHESYYGQGKAEIYCSKYGYTVMEQAFREIEENFTGTYVTQFGPIDFFVESAEELDNTMLASFQLGKTFGTLFIQLVFA